MYRILRSIVTGSYFLALFFLPVNLLSAKGGGGGGGGHGGGGHGGMGGRSWRDGGSAEGWAVMA